MNYKISPLKTALILLGFFITHSTYGQDSVLRRNQVKISPIKIVDLMNPGFEASYEHIFSRHFSLQAGGAILHDVVPVLNYKAYGGYRIFLEGKYLIPMRDHSRLYVAGDLTYNHVYIRDIGEFTATGNLSYPQYYSDTFSVNKQTLSFNVKAGMMLSFHRFIIDFGLGLGLKYYHAVHLDRLHPDDPRHFDSYEFNIHQTGELPGTYFTLNVPCTLRVGYSF